MNLPWKDDSFWPGLVWVAALTTVASVLAAVPWALRSGVGAPILAVLVGIALGNSLYIRHMEKTLAGVLFAKSFLLRAGIILYGFRITIADIGQVGVNAFAVDVVMLLGTFFLTCWFGLRWLNMDRQTVYLTATGCSICGAAAIMAAQPVTRAEAHQVSVAIAVIVLFGSLSMLLYPLFYSWLQGTLGDHQFGIYVGSSVHEVAQVYAAGSAINAEVATTAVITKMLRVMMLAPFLLALSWRLSGKGDKIDIPWFALLFILVAALNSLNLLPQAAVRALVWIDGLLLTAAMAALGLTTRIKALLAAGWKPLLLGALVYLWLFGGGLAVNWMAEWFL